MKQIPDNQLLDKKAKEELLKAVESGELNASDILAELADAAEKAKVVEEKNATLEKQKETLEKAKTALETAKKNSADQAIQDGLQDAVTKLEASVASAKVAADEAKADFDEVNEAVQEDDDAIAKLTDDYNATLGYIENLKEVPKGEEPKDFSSGVNPSDAPSDDAKQPDQVPSAPNSPEFNSGVNSLEAAINEVPAYVETGAPAITEVPEYTLTTAGTNKDNTYQAPAVKTEDKKELQNTGGKDNVAVASLGFLGLFLGALPFVKRKN